MIDGDAAPNEDERRMLQWLADVHRRREQAEAEVARCAAEEREGRNVVSRAKVSLRERLAALSADSPQGSSPCPPSASPVDNELSLPAT